MQRPRGISAYAEDAPDDRDAGVRLSAALNRLAALRATIHGDWSDGPASLLAYATTDGDDGDRLGWALLTPTTRYTPPSIDPPAIMDAPVALRGRFEVVEERDLAIVDHSWLDLVSDVAVIDTPIADATPAPAIWRDPDIDGAALLEAVGVVTQDEAAVALAFAEDCAAMVRRAAAPPEPGVV